MKYQQNLLIGALLVVVAEFCMASMGALVKLLGETMPNEMAVFARNLAGLLVLLPVLLSHREFTLKTECLHLHLLRSLAGLAAMYCFFYAIIHLPLADSMLLKMTAPLFMPIIAIVWLSEGITQWTVLALLVGFSGVWVILDPTGEINWAVLVGIAGGLLAAVAKVSIRRLSRTEPNLRVITYFALVGTIVSAGPAIFSWTMPDINGIRLMAAIGLVGTLGQLALTRAYSISNAGKVAPLTYFSVIFGGLYGFIFWDEIPDERFMLGALLIAVAGVLTIRKPAQRKSLPETVL